jgi:Malate/L-lactate dehydrogenase
MPEGWRAADHGRHPAQQGALPPFDGKEGGYKWFGLALAMDALGTLSAGVRSAGAVSGSMFFAFKPVLFASADAYRHEVGRRIGAIKATPRQAGITEIRIPGERSYATRARLLREGIEIDRKIHDALGLAGETSIMAVEGSALHVGDVVSWTKKSPAPMVVDAKIHLWAKGTPAAHHRCSICLAKCKNKHCRRQVCHRDDEISVMTDACQT